jgi:hypothetical protein
MIANDANWFAVFMKAFVEQYDGQMPSRGQWDMMVQILKSIPTEKLSRESV